MAQIKTEQQYKALCDRINELLTVVGNDTPADDKNMLELDLISDLVADYEEEHYPITAPTLVETIKLRMYEMGLNQKKLAEMLGQHGTSQRDNHRQRRTFNKDGQRNQPEAEH